MELLKSKWEIDFIELLEFLIDFSKKQEEKLKNEFQEKKAQKVSDLLKNLLKDQKNGWLNNFNDILQKYWWWEQKIYASWYVLTTMWIVYSIFLNKQNFEALLDSINIGWDVDTFAAIIWNMIWAYKWEFYDKYYENWVNNINQYKNQINLFLNTILEKKNSTDLTSKEYKQKLKNFNLEKQKIKQKFFKEIKELNNKTEDIFYNSKWTPEAFRNNVKHISFAETLKYWKIQDRYFVVEKEFFLADFTWYTIQKMKKWEKIKFIKLNILK
jgi:hypothetical protein